MGWAAGAAIGLQALGGIADAAGAERQASASATASRYQSAVAANNAAIARNNATMAMRVGEAKANQQELKNRATVGAIVAQQAGNGVDVNTGSAKDVQESARRLGRLDTMTIRSDASRDAYGYETQAANFDTESKLAKRQAKQAKSAGNLSAFTSLLSAATGAAGTYARFADAGGAGGAPTVLSSGANVLDTNYWAPNDTGAIY